MTTFKTAHPWLIEAVKNAGGQIVTVGSKPWCQFIGPDAEERAQSVLTVFNQLYGYKHEGTKPWRPDQTNFDYAIRLDP